MALTIAGRERRERRKAAQREKAFHAARGPSLPTTTSQPRGRGRSPRGYVTVAAVALFVSLCGASLLKLKDRAGPERVVTPTALGTTVSTPSTLPPVAFTSTDRTALLVGTAVPSATVQVGDLQTLADLGGWWRIAVQLAPGINYFQAIAISPSGLQLEATVYTVTYTPLATTVAIPSETTAAAPVGLDTPVTISLPLDGAVLTTRRITTSGTAAPGAHVNAAGNVVTANRKGAWSAFVTLKPGANKVTVIATAPGGGVTTASISVRYNIPPTTTTEATAPVNTSPSQTTASPEAAP